ncbi:MAG: hypothetical protein ACM3PS_06405 [Syntrophothermus sp.]
MFKKVVLIFVVLAAFLATASPALALQGVPTKYYVDTAYTGTEVGTQSQPFNTLNEAIAAGQAQPYGAYIYTRQYNGTWAYYGYIPGVYPPATGGSLSGPALFVVLGIFSLILIVGGWFLLRRSRSQA